MNAYEKFFFKRYIPKENEVLHVIHRHIVLILDRLFIILLGGVAIPSFLYIQSIRIQELIPLQYFQIYLYCIFLKIVYDIFNWYNDVWIISNDSVFDLRWSLFKSNIESVHYDNIEGIETEQNGIIDTFLGKGNLMIHKHGDDTIRITHVSRPFEAANLLSEYTHKPELEPEKDRFELILQTLGGIVNEYLDRKGIRETQGGYQDRQEQFIEEISHSQNTIDLRDK